LKTLKLFFAVCILCVISGCTRGDDAKRILETQGFTEVKTTGYRAFACGEDYTFHTGFEAKAPVTGKKVTGTVCSGVLKGSSIKFD